MRTLFSMLLVCVCLSAHTQGYRLEQTTIITANTSQGQWTFQLSKPVVATGTDITGLIIGQQQGSNIYHNRLLGYATVNIAHGNATATSTGNDDFQSGDQVILLVGTTENPKHAGILHALATQDLFFLKPKGDAYYSYDQALAGTKGWEDQLLATLLADVKKVVPTANNNTVLNFLQSVNATPQRYWGRKLNLAHEYQQWSSAGSLDFNWVEQIEQAVDGAEVERIKKANADKHTPDLLLQYIIGSNIRFAANQKTDNAHGVTINTVVQLMAMPMKDQELATLLYECASGLSGVKLYAESASAYGMAAQRWQAHDPEAEARAVSKQAEALHYAKQYTDALDHYQKALNLWRVVYQKNSAAKIAATMITVLDGIAEISDLLEQPDATIQAYQEQLSLYKRLDNTRMRGSVYWNLGYTYSTKKKLPDASNKNYERAYQAFDSVKHIPGAVTVLCNQAINWRNQKDYKKALEVGQRAEAYARANLHTEMEGYAAVNIMETYVAMENKAKAAEAFKTAEKKYQEAEAFERLATLYDTEASRLSEVNKHLEAANASMSALLAYEKFAQGKNLADAYWNAGYYMSYADKLEESNNLYAKAIAYYEDVSDASTSLLYANIGVNHRDAGDSAQAFQAHQKAITLAENSGDTTTMIKSHEKFYQTYKHFRQFKGMVEESAKAAYLYYMSKNGEKAAEEYKKTLTALDSLITQREEAKQYQEASNAYSLKSQIYELMDDKANQAQSIFYMGNELTFTNLPDAKTQALRYYRQSRAIYETLPDFYNVVMYINIEIAGIYKAQKKLDSAYYYLDLAIAKGEETKYWKNLADAYKAKADYKAEEKQYEGATGALALMDKAIEAYGKIPDASKKSDAQKTQAARLNELKQYENSSKMHLQRLADADKKDAIAVAGIHWDYAVALSYLPARRKESNEYYLKAATAYKQEGQNKNYLILLHNIAINHRDGKDSVNTYKVLRNALKEVRSSNGFSKENLAYVLEKLGFMYKHFGHHSQAMKARKEAGEIYWALADTDNSYTLVEDAGESAEAAKLFDQAIQHYQRTLSMAESTKNESRQANAMFNIAYAMSTHQRKYKESIPVWEKSYDLYLQARDTANASIVRGNVGQQLWSLYDFDGAIQNHEKSIALATQGKYYTQVASSWRKLADLYRETKNVVKESEAIQKAIQTLEMLNDTTQLRSAYIDIAQSLASARELTKASTFFDKALTLAQAQKDSSAQALIYYKYGNAYYSNNLETATAHYRKAETLQRKLKDKENLIYTIAMHGSLILENNRTQAEKYMNEAMALAKEIKDNTLLAFCHSRLYDLNRELGKQTDVARKHWEESTRLYQQMGDKVSITNNYITRAYEYLYDYGDFSKAQEYMAKARLLLDSIKNPLTTAYFHGQQANIYSDQGQYDLAIAELDQSSDIYRDVKNDWNLAGNYISYGNIYRALGEYELALRYQSMSDSAYHALKLEYQRYPPISNIGDVYFYQGDYPKALEQYKRALKYLEDNHDQNTNLCKIYSGVGLTYSNMEQYEEAEKWYKKALDVSTKIQASRVHAEVLNFIGKLKIETKQYEEAEKFLLEAKNFDVSHQLMIERTINATNLGHLYLKKGDLPKAKAELNEAITLAEQFGKDDVLWEAYFRMGVYHRKSNNLKDARSLLLKSVGVIDKLRNNVVGGEEAKKLFSSDKWIMEAYEELIAILLEMGEIEEAMAWLQKINENNVRDKIRSMDVTFEDDDKNKTLAQEKEMKMKLETLEKQIAAQKQAKNQNADQLKTLESIRTVAESDYLKFVNQQVNVQPELSKYFSNTVQPSQLKGKKKQIPKDMALVSYLVGEKQLYIFVATSDTVVARIVAVPKEKIHRDVTAMINITKSHLGSFGKIELTAQEAERQELIKTSKQTDQVLKPFEDAYHYLISPVGELIANKTKLGIIATGELNYIPFQLLGKTLNSGKFSLLINQYALFYTNSTDMLLRAAPDDKAINILAFGNPDKTLPATEKEVKDIQSIFPNTKVYLRDDATEDKAKYAPEQYNVMHFATHGNLDYEDFSKSYLTMASNTAKNEDGMLTLEELWGMEVMSHLNIVVLSACQTAVTKGSDESSPVSPASGFLQNGVKSVVATLWKVDDEATSLLMNDFYKNIKTMDAVDAMRLAQSKLANNPKFAHPYYWGAMVLIGDWR